MTTLPTVNSMTWLEESLYYGLLSCDLFNTANIVQERKFQMAAELQRDAIWMTPRGNATGVGLFVEMPHLRVEKPNSTVNMLVGGVVIFEERNVNFTAALGSQKSSEEWSLLVAEFLRGWILGQAGGLVIEPDAVAPARDFMEMYPGIVCYRASVSQRLSRTLVPRCNQPTLAAAGLTVTITNGAETPDADIYYTLDGSFPGIASQATQYAAPFDVDSGTLVQFAAHKVGFFPSHVGAKIVT